MDESEALLRDRPALSEAALAESRVALKAWVRSCDFFDGGFPEDRDIDAFLAGLFRQRREGSVL
jgi:hypothetical protein